MSCISQNFRLFHVSNLSVRNFRIFLLMYPGSIYCDTCSSGSDHDQISSWSHGSHINGQFNNLRVNELFQLLLDALALKPAVHLHTPNRLIAEFNMGAYEYALTRRVSVAIATHVKFSD